MIRAIIKTFSGALHKIARVTASGVPGEVFENREAMQHYGYASRPKAGAEGVIVCEGNHFLMIADDDRRYRIALEQGEVALYTDEGDKIHLKRGRKIDIVAGDSATPGLITVTAPGTTGKVVINAMNIELGAGVLEKILMGESFQTLFNTHTHTAGFVTPTTPPVLPSTVLELSTVVKAAK